MIADKFATLMLLGTSRFKEPPASPFAVVEEAWSALDWSQPEKAALSACALRAAALGAGFQAKQHFAAEEACGMESRATVPTAAGTVLRRILDGEAPECLSEWLERCAFGGFVAAPRDLPALFAKARQEASLRPQIAAIMGERGAWLARRENMEQLFPVSNVPADEAWETGQIQERVAWLGHWRTTDAEQAAAALANVWPQESAENRIAFLTALGSTPNEAEISLLETQALKDRRREVRLLARALLMSFPTGAFVTRAFARVRDLLKVEGLLKKRLVLELPSQFDSNWKDDGLEEKVPAGLKGIGPRAYHAIQLLGCVPLPLWTVHFQMEFSKLLTLNRDDESAGILLLGWMESAQAAPEAVTAEALARHLASLESWPANGPPMIPTLLRLISVLPDETAATIVELAEANVLKTSAPGQLFSASTFPVPPTAASRWLEMILHGLRAKPLPVFYSPAARQLAMRLPAAIIPEALQRLSQEETLSSPAEAFGRALEFRLQLHQSFSTATFTPVQTK